MEKYILHLEGSLLLCTLSQQPWERGLINKELTTATLDQSLMDARDNQCMGKFLYFGACFFISHQMSSIPITFGTRFGALSDSSCAFSPLPIILSIAW